MVLPSRVIIELDGLKERRSGGGSDGSNPLLGLDTVARAARRVTSFLLETRRSPQSEWLVQPSSTDPDFLTDAMRQVTGGRDRGGMRADLEILAVALATRARLASEGDEVMLVTGDKNLQLLAGAHSLPSASLEEVRGALRVRDEVWQSAYRTSLAQGAVAAAMARR